jgi:hypothetical protein
LGFLVGGLLLMMVLAGCSLLGGDSDEPGIPESKLPALVLQPADLADVFVRFDEGPLAIADAPAGERGDPERFGRIGGWKARYRRPGSPSTSGPLVLESRIDLFESSNGAEREFDTHADELDAQARHPTGAELGEVEMLGDEALVLIQGTEEVRGSVRFYTVLWRDGNATASLVANGFSDRIDVAEVLELARAQQRRIAASTG